jgi:alanine or glycine:cation symporter, AGCS family
VKNIDAFLTQLVGYAWGMPMLFLLVVGGLVLTIYSRFLPFRSGRHALQILLGKFDDPNDPGQISHFEALSTALSSTIGMGNIGGVAIAISQGGAGAVFWMWVAAIVGMGTKFFTCTLAVLYRGEDSVGDLQGGPMYFMSVGLGGFWRGPAAFFSVCGMVGCLAMFQTNQMAEILYVSFKVPHWITGAVSSTLVGIVILGGIKRIASVASRLVPAMCLLYLVMAIAIVIRNYEVVPAVLQQIFHDAFTGTAAAGGAAAIAFRTALTTGIKRAAFSNEAGIGTAPMAHGAVKTDEPVREGLVAMLGPFIDTIVVCTITAIVILSAAPWQGAAIKGTALTAAAFENSLGMPGKVGLMIIVVLFGMTTMFGYSYYGKKCFSYLFGAEQSRIYDIVYLMTLFAGAVWSANMVVNLLDSAFALMAIPNIIATLFLAKKVMDATQDYYKRQFG